QALNLSCQGVFIFVGIQPHTDFLKKLLQLDEAGFIITDENLATSQEGIFACGDCRKKNLYQVINACAEGAVAANSAHTYLLK
ncbi:MAG: FAD-dependent oxidoreductase, partial [Candidatus Omnitrophica bacterium]|nr:FAD-dependent oxidoreductase [Candidatus Omnitrophota bacterium]